VFIGAATQVLAHAARERFAASDWEVGSRGHGRLTACDRRSPANRPPRRPARPARCGRAGWRTGRGRRAWPDDRALPAPLVGARLLVEAGEGALFTAAVAWVLTSRLAQTSGTRRRPFRPGDVGRAGRWAPARSRSCRGRRRGRRLVGVSRSPSPATATARSPASSACASRTRRSPEQGARSAASGRCGLPDQPSVRQPTRRPALPADAPRHERGRWRRPAACSSRSRRLARARSPASRPADWTRHWSIPRSPHTPPRSSGPAAAARPPAPSYPAGTSDWPSRDRWAERSSGAGHARADPGCRLRRAAGHGGAGPRHARRGGMGRMTVAGPRLVPATPKPQ
jgi:hypothetical protein